MDLAWVPKSEMQRVLDAPGPAAARAAAFAALCRLNVLYMVKRAGSGHLGTSFSCLDLVAWIFLQEMEIERDVCFSSKGHDVPAFYSILTALGLLEYEKIHALRRLGGLPGHPEVDLPRMEANTGSLGMGISKAKGKARGRRWLGRPATFFVVTGDGELDEGQIWESLPQAANHGLAEIFAIVDHNKIQSDTWVRRVSDLGSLEDKWRSFGWEVARCDGHDFDAIGRALGALRAVRDRPKVLVADTVKGRGVSFMEAFGPTDDYYGYHSGAPSDDEYVRALAELRATADRALEALGQGPVVLERVSIEVAHSPQPRHRLVDVYAREIVRHAAENPRLVALDADLVKDCGLVEFARRFPDRLVECGIAEQDMVSQAGGLALEGMLPVCHSFAAFLSARPNEQIYANATERTKVVYVATLAGLLPGTPGHSHQSVRDIAALAAVPGLVLVAPATEPDVARALDFCLNGTAESSYLRLCSIPCILPFEASADRLVLGRGRVLREGRDGVVFAYGPVMTAQAHSAATLLAAEGIDLKVVDLPWLNRVDDDWLRETTAGLPWIFTVDDHYVTGGQGDFLLARLAELGWPRDVRARKLGVAEIPVCGQNDEVLRHHRLDAEGLAETIRRSLQTGAVAPTASR